MIPKLWGDVSLIEDTHQYFDNDQREYLSVSKLADLIEPEFEADRISYFKARKDLSIELGIDKDEVSKELIKQRAELLRVEWANTNKDSIDHGNRIHLAIENYFKYLKISDKDEDLKPLLTALFEEYKHYKYLLSEQVLYSPEHRVSGTADKICFRKVGRTKNHIADYKDYKTNKSKGIEFYNERNDYLKKPFDHLMNCSYNLYALKMSLYAYMGELQGITPASISLVYIPPENPLNFKEIYLPYMKLEAELLLKLRMQKIPFLEEGESFHTF